MTPMVRIELRPELTVAQVAALRTAVGWDASEHLYERTLGRTFAWAGGFDGSRLIAFGDVVSDGVADAFVRDFIVHPDYLRGRTRRMGAASS